MTAVPTAPAELEEWLAEPDNIKVAMTEPETFKEVVGNYARVCYAKDTAMLDQIREQTQATLAQWLKDNPSAQLQRVNLDPTTGPTRYAPKANPRAAGAPLNGVFTDVQDMLSTMWHGANRTSEAEVKYQQVRNYSEKVPAGNDTPGRHPSACPQNSDTVRYAPFPPRREQTPARWRHFPACRRSTCSAPEPCHRSCPARSRR